MEPATELLLRIVPYVKIIQEIFSDINFSNGISENIFNILLGTRIYFFFIFFIYSNSVNYRNNDEFFLVLSVITMLLL